MEFDNKTLIIIIVGVCAVLGLINNQTDISNFALGGLVGYLTKDMSDKVIDYIQTSNPDCPKTSTPLIEEEVYPTNDEVVEEEIKGA